MEYFTLNREEFDYQYVVMLSDIDQFQHMSFANYLKLMFLASDAFFLGFAKKEKDFFSRFYLYPVHSQMHFKRQTAFGDEILIKVHSGAVSEKGFDLYYEFDSGVSGQDVAEGRQSFEVMDMATGRAVAMPTEIAEVLGIIAKAPIEKFSPVERFADHPASRFAGDNRYFVFDKLAVFFKHTNHFGIAHPYNFLEWTSYVREAFFQGTVRNFREVTGRPIKMMTTKIASNVLSPSSFGDEIEARLTVGKIRKVSFEMMIRFWNRTTKKVTCETAHTIVFVDSVSGRFAEIPPEMSEVIARYKEPEVGKEGSESHA